MRLIRVAAATGCFFSQKMTIWVYLKSIACSRTYVYARWVCGSERGGAPGEGGRAGPGRPESWGDARSYRAILQGDPMGRSGVTFSALHLLF